MENDEVSHIWSSDEGKWIPVQTDEELDELCQDDMIESMQLESSSDHKSDEDDLC